MQKIKFSVSDFAVPVRKCGSLTREGMLLGKELGSDIHQIIQNKQSRNTDYKKEVPLKFQFSTRRFCFQATLKPFDFYKTLSGFDESTMTYEFATAFPEENRKVMIIPQISTSYKLRGLYYKKIAAVVERISHLNKGNYLVFFPSYEFLEKTEAFFQNSEFEILRQSKDMKTEDLAELENRLMTHEHPTIVLAVQGGALSEGIDLNTRSLKGVFIVGPAVPAICYERGLRKEFYDKKFGDGFSYAYIYPAMAKSIQAAGRVIRSDTKQGLIVMMDCRFVQKTYVETMPRYWFQNSIKELVSTQILADVKSFWSEKKRAPNKDCPGNFIAL